LLNRPPVRFGKGATQTVWQAIEAPTGQSYYVRADGTRTVPSPQRDIAEVQTAYEQDGSQHAANRNGPPAVLPAEVASELASIEAMHRSIVSEQPIEQWRFEGVRGRYQALLKRAGDDRAVEEAVRVQLARVTRHEQAAQAARTIRSTLARSHSRDQSVTDVERRLGHAGRSAPRSYHAVGLVKPSSSMVGGRRLYTLIGSDGSTIAFLDVPPGLDLEPLLTHKVGVRGVSHYDEALNARLITVREMESLESRR
jgi:hypothetical protein